jgi:hypothetical protein
LTSARSHLHVVSAVENPVFHSLLTLRRFPLLTPSWSLLGRMRRRWPLPAAPAARFSAAPNSQCPSTARRQPHCNRSTLRSVPISRSAPPTLCLDHRRVWLLWVYSNDHHPRHVRGGPSLSIRIVIAQWPPGRRPALPLPMLQPAAMMPPQRRYRL